MTRASKLIPVIEMAVHEADKVMQNLVQSNQMLQKEKQQLEDLQGYREEYLQRFRQGHEMHMSARKAIDLRAFLAQLDHTIRLQQNHVERCLVHSQKLQQVWLQAKSKQRSLESLKERYQKEAEQKQLKLEQRQADEHTAMIWSRKTR